MIRDLMIGGASVEDTLTLWALSLRDVKQRIRPLFTRERVAASAGQFLDGLLGNGPRKTGWMRRGARDRRDAAVAGRARRRCDHHRHLLRRPRMGYLRQGRHRRHFARPWKQGLAYLETNK
jgi:hypothetical protein